MAFFFVQVAPAFGAAALTGVARDTSKTPPIARAPHLRMVNYEDSALRVLGLSGQNSSLRVVSWGSAKKLWTIGITIASHS